MRAPAPRAARCRGVRPTCPRRRRPTCVWSCRGRQRCRRCSPPPRGGAAPKRRCWRRSPPARRRSASSIPPRSPPSCAPCARSARTMPGACSRSRRRSPTASEPAVKKQPATPLSREADAFIEMLAAERCASKHTEAAYSGGLKNLEAFLARRKQKPVTASADALPAHLKSLDYLGMTQRTVARRLSVMRQFFRFLLAERRREDDPASTLDSPRLGRSLPKILSRVE